MKLTKREQEVIKLLCLQNKVICERLSIKNSTLNQHIENLMCKFSPVATRSALPVEAAKRGLITLDEIETE